MFPVHNYGQNFPNQASGFRNGVRIHQRRHLLPTNTMISFGSNQMSMPAIGMNSSQQSLFRPNGNLRTQLLGAMGPNENPHSRAFDAIRGQKRRNDDNTSQGDKRARQNLHQPSSSAVSSTVPSEALPREPLNTFIVPVSHGTEKITVEIWDYFLSAKMKDEDLAKKFQLQKSLQAIFKGTFANCRLFIVGSSMTGFATRTSDVDMCLMLTVNEVDQRKDALHILHSISKSLRRLTSLQQQRVIKAKVPILKFFDNSIGVECDLNINNLIGVRNTHLLRFYACMDWRVRPLMLFIKRWARFHDINDASKQTISSYSLTLMLIHYLQAGINPPVVPCLQKIRPDLFDTRIDVRLLPLKFENCIDFSSSNQATLGELFLGFLNYYTNVFSFENQVISIRLGKALSFKEANSGASSMQMKHLNVEEPFERSNTARSVFDKFVFMRILRVFEKSYNTLENSRDVDQILTRPF